MKKATEARKWIGHNQEGTFANHVFPKKEQALEFVDKLYSLGAESVTVGNIETEEDWKRFKGSQFEPEMYEGKVIKIYADELIVNLPEEKDKRQSIFSFVNHFREEASEHYEETGQKSISIFWDY